MYTNKKIPVLLSLLWLVSNTSTAEVFTEQSAIEYGLNHHPNVAIALNEINRFDSDIAQVYLRDNPQLSLASDNLRSQDGSEMALSLEQSVDLFGKRGHRAKALSAQQIVAKHDKSIIALSVVATIRRTFAAALAAQEQYELSIKSKNLAAEAVNSVTGKVKAGRVSKAEQIKAELQFSTAQMNTRLVKQKLDTALLDLTRSLGNEAINVTSVKGEIVRTIPTMDYSDLKQLFENSPFVLRWQAQIEQANAKSRSIKRDALPEMAWAASVTRDQDDDAVFGAGISIELPLFNRNQGALQSQKTKMQSTLLENAYARRQHELAIKMNLGKARQLMEQTTLLADHMLPNANEVYIQIKHAYQLGKVTYLDLLDAQRTLVETQQMQITAQLNLQLAIIELDYLTGSSADSNTFGETL